jgi:hypothetical protein
MCRRENRIFFIVVQAPAVDPSGELRTPDFDGVGVKIFFRSYISKKSEVSHLHIGRLRKKNSVFL